MRKPHASLVDELTLRARPAIVHTPLAQPLLSAQAYDAFVKAAPIASAVAAVTADAGTGTSPTFSPPPSLPSPSLPASSASSSSSPPLPPALAAAVARLTYLDPFNAERAAHSSAKRRHRLACPLRGHCGEADLQHAPLVYALVGGLGARVSSAQHASGHAPRGGNLRREDVRIKAEKDDAEYEELVAFERTAYQRALVYWTPRKGLHFSLDGVTQSVEIDEKTYHEALVHTPLLLYPRAPGAASVVIIGGGEGATVREVLRHGSVERLVMAELDGAVAHMCRAHLPSWSAGGFDDARTTLAVGDGKAYMERAARASVDVIIMDTLDPLDGKLSFPLFSVEFFATLHERLTEDGLLLIQGGQFDEDDEWPTYDTFATILGKLRRVFAHVTYYSKYVRTFDGYWGFMVACKTCHYKSELMIEILKYQRLYAGMAAGIDELRVAAGLAPLLPAESDRPTSAPAAVPDTRSVVGAPSVPVAPVAGTDDGLGASSPPPPPPTADPFAIDAAASPHRALLSVRAADAGSSSGESSARSARSATDTGAVFHEVDWARASAWPHALDGTVSRIVAIVDALVPLRIASHATLKSFDGVSVNGMFTIHRTTRMGIDIAFHQQQQVRARASG
jgi:spermidine synthase